MHRVVARAARRTSLHFPASLDEIAGARLVRRFEAPRPSTMTCMRRLLAALLLASAVSCDTFDPLIENTVTGTWRGSSTGQTFLVVMQQSGTTVAGTGTITGTGGVKNLSVSGTFTEPTFNGTLTPNGEAPITLVGTVEGRSLVGTLTGGGFNGAGLALTRD